MRFIVNEQLIETKRSPGTPLLTFLREDLRLCGSKAGCREGDCGACTVLIGALDDKNQLEYYSVVSCLMPLGNCIGKHILTIEGIAQDHLNQFQSAILEEGATQCGFCTPGIIMSLLDYLLNNQQGDIESALDGNICRCTGYKSIQRAMDSVKSKIKGKLSIAFMVSEGYLPKYIQDINLRLKQIQSKIEASHPSASILIGGGTDLMLQRQEELMDADLSFHSRNGSSIRIEHNTCHIPGNATVASLQSHDGLAMAFPELIKTLRLFASTPIRNMATVAGNIVNASPIGDLSILLLALNARITVSGNGSTRQMPLDQFFQSYKKTALKTGEVITSITFDIPPVNARFNFEKISKRKILDIATVNAASVIKPDKSSITECRISAGGVSPIPLYLKKTSKALIGPLPDVKRLNEIIEIMNEEISPISDIRGSEKYKRLILRQLLLAHLMPLVGEKNVLTILHDS